jgi:hypothetical protein
MPAKNNLAHTKRECKYHLAFIPKFRRKSLCRSVDCRPRVARRASLVPSPTSQPCARFTSHVPLFGSITYLHGVQLFSYGTYKKIHKPLG